MTPKAYEDESKIQKVKLLLKWISSTVQVDEVISGNQKIHNINEHLENMAHNGFLRLFENENEIIVKDYLSSTSWIALGRFKRAHMSDRWICPVCSKCFVEDGNQGNIQNNWKCSRCLFFYHDVCARPKTINTKTQCGFDTQYDLCFSCF